MDESQEVINEIPDIANTEDYLKWLTNRLAEAEAQILAEAGNRAEALSEISRSIADEIATQVQNMREEMQAMIQQSTPASESTESELPSPQAETPPQETPPEMMPTNPPPTDDVQMEAPAQSQDERPAEAEQLEPPPHAPAAPARKIRLV